MAKQKKQNPDHKWLVGAWYKTTDGWLINYQRGNHVYGFTTGSWNEDSGDWRITPKTLEENNFVEATKNDISKRLVAEARKRGFNDGVTYKQIHQKTPITLKGGAYVFNYDMDSNSLTMYNSGGSYLIFDSGKWAEIISETKELAIDIPFEVGDLFGVTADTGSQRWEITSIENGEVKYKETIKRIGYTEQLSDFIKKVENGKFIIIKKEKPKPIEYDLPFKVGEYYETADGTIVLIWVIEFEDGEVFVREQKGNTQITYTTNEVKYFIEQGDWVKQGQPKSELYKIGDVFQVPNGNIFKITSFDDKKIQYESLDGKSKQDFYRSVVDPHFVSGEWKFVDQEPEIKEGQIYVYIQGGNVIKYEIVMVRETHVNWKLAYNNEATVRVTDKDVIKDLIKNGEWVLQTGEPNEEAEYYYGIMSQEELKTLLRTYTSLAEKGNEDAKKEILILQTLIK